MKSILWGAGRSSGGSPRGSMSLAANRVQTVVRWDISTRITSGGEARNKTYENRREQEIPSGLIRKRAQPLSAGGRFYLFKSPAKPAGASSGLHPASAPATGDDPGGGEADHPRHQVHAPFPWLRVPMRASHGRSAWLAMRIHQGKGR